MNGIPKKYIAMLVQISKHCPDCDGADYQGSRQLVEYIIGVTIVNTIQYIKRQIHTWTLETTINSSTAIGHNLV